MTPIIRPSANPMSHSALYTAIELNAVMPCNLDNIPFNFMHTAFILVVCSMFSESQRDQISLERDHSGQALWKMAVFSEMIIICIFQQVTTALYSTVVNKGERGEKDLHSCEFTGECRSESLPGFS